LYQEITIKEDTTMTQEDKELLQKDLCARLPYKTAVSVCGIPFHWDYRKFIDDPRHFKSYLNDILRGDIKPYLFPLSSMSEEQKQEFMDTCTFLRDSTFGWTDRTFDWLNENHFDYRGLIPKGLAIDATGLNIY
jgi:hypothetical protein